MYRCDSQVKKPKFWVGLGKLRKIKNDQNESQKFPTPALKSNIVLTTANSQRKEKNPLNSGFCKEIRLLSISNFLKIRTRDFQEHPYRIPFYQKPILEKSNRIESCGDRQTPPSLPTFQSPTLQRRDPPLHSKASGHYMNGKYRSRITAHAKTTGL